MASWVDVPCKLLLARDGDAEDAIELDDNILWLGAKRWETLFWFKQGEEVVVECVIWFRLL